MNSLFSADASLREVLVGLPRSTKKLIGISTDFAGFLACAIVAALAVSGLEFDVTASLALAFFLSISLALGICWSQGLYRSIVRYIGHELYLAALTAALAAGLSGLLTMYVIKALPSPYRWSFVFAALVFIYVVTSRALARLFLIRQRTRVSRDRVIIYGAGRAGAQLSTGLLGGDKFLPVAFIDEDTRLQGTTVNGLVVYPREKLDEIVEETGASRVLLAIPRASLQRRRKVLEHLSEYKVRVQTMPSLEKIVAGEATVDDIREVEVPDLLGRDPVAPSPKLLYGAVTGKNVMISGAGGSIGSELSRQILQLNPKRLVLFERSEFALYKIERELERLTKETDGQCEIIALLGSVKNEKRLRETIDAFEIQTIFHAAAYKHVPIVEQNPLEGVDNNIFGTLQIAKLSAEQGVEKFVLISTDKAVSPTNIMGASKRVSELILQALQDDHPDTCFCMVRFGNVLDSSGSVVPLFKEQIRAGGPVTVTHRDIVRYFMTIPEAAELVIQAAAMAKGGEVFVLDMGEPVRILDLAKRMIHLMGFSVCSTEKPDGDIRIEFTGLRPAEKLYEELLIGSNVSGTEHPRILRANEEKIPSSELFPLLDELRSAMHRLDRSAARALLKRMVGGYSPESDIADHVWVSSRGEEDEADSSDVIDFPISSRS